MEKYNKDKGKPNNNGYKLIEICQMHNLYFINGRVGEDRNIGKVICKGVSTVDYAIGTRVYF